MLPLKIADPMFSIKVSPEEKGAAAKVRVLFEEFSKSQEELTRYLKNFFDELNNTKDTANIQKIGPLLKKYIHKYRDLCNDFITSLEKAVQYMTCNFKDADMTDIRDLVVESVKEVRNLSKDLIILFKNIGETSFVENIKQVYEKISDRLEKLDGIISDELFGHIDYNILGKIRLSFQHVPLSIKQGN